jgi:hypothetical protein
VGGEGDVADAPRDTALFVGIRRAHGHRDADRFPFHDGGADADVSIFGDLAFIEVGPVSQGLGELIVGRLGPIRPFGPDTYLVWMTIPRLFARDAVRGPSRQARRLGDVGRSQRNARVLGRNRRRRGRWRRRAPHDVEDEHRNAWGEKDPSPIHRGILAEARGQTEACEIGTQPRVLKVDADVPSLSCPVGLRTPQTGDLSPGLTIRGAKAWVK